MVLSVKSNPDAGQGRARPSAAAVAEPPTAGSGDVTGRVLDTAEELFYARGIQAVGMDAIRDRSGVPLKRLYQCFASKEQLVVAVLERRDVQWRERLSTHVNRIEDPQSRILAVYEWLGQWFTEPGFRGCAWINSYGELGGVSRAVAEQAQRHKAAFRRYLGQLVADAELPVELTDQLALLADGAMADAGIFATAAPASQARAAAETLVRAATGGAG
jgi:AcrR family transcriptional regulator